ncbi:MAG: YifB family Mg chelatase-like AAA ATPase, partial [Clostridiales bacterium]|nr:YifB family Mg chelatase-like AAA ATPase [Clostridiales bacterium]
MYSTVCTAALSGIRAFEVRVEADISTGMPSFDMLGNLAQEVREARERVRTALHSCGIVLPPKKITVNLSPANVKKYGTGFDLAIAVALLVGCGLVDSQACRDVLFVGELGLNGQILPVNGILPIVSDGNCESYVVPAANLQEAQLVPDAKAYGFAHIKELMDYLNGKPYQAPPESEDEPQEERQADFAEVYGQTLLKRCCEIAAAGMHNLLIIGPPGAGKTMVSQRMSTILPPMTKEEQLSLSKIYSVCGMLAQKHSLITERPFRSPHHTITQAALAGGGRTPKPGEVSLAHHGVLFLDEMPEFQKASLEVLRQPMENREIVINRLNDSITYPSDFLLLASMNPCNCGYYPNMQKCRCTPGSIRRYLSRLSQPLLDRIDLGGEAPPLYCG